MYAEPVHAKYGALSGASLKYNGSLTGSFILGYDGRPHIREACMAVLY
jgi:hypothetical protein